METAARVRKKISIVSPCFNEEENISELYLRVRDELEKESEYDFEYIFVDNSSTDNTLIKLKELAKFDSRVKIIVNNRNFGHIRSPYWGLINSFGDCTIYLASDLQDPPEMISQFIRQWEHGSKIVLAVKPVSKTNWFLHTLRKTYYHVLDYIADIELVKDSTGFGLYDRAVLDKLREINDPYPFLRGLICELGYEINTILFEQPRRQRGISKNNFYTLFDIAMLGIVSHSKVPLRLATFMGFFLAFASFVAALCFFFYKILNWNEVPVGLAPFEIIVMLLFGVLFIFIGLLGEYMASIQCYIQNRPIVVEKERINF